MGTKHERDNAEKMVEIAYRTEVATLSAKGAWNVVDAEVRRTDCAASAIGPSLRGVHGSVRKGANNNNQ